MTNNRITGWFGTQDRGAVATTPLHGAFVMCPPILLQGGWQWQVYQAAYAEARAVVRELSPVLAGVVSVN